MGEEQCEDYRVQYSLVPQTTEQIHHPCDSHYWDYTRPHSESKCLYSTHVSGLTSGENLRGCTTWDFPSIDPSTLT